MWWELTRTRQVMQLPNWNPPLLLSELMRLFPTLGLSLSNCDVGRRGFLCPLSRALALSVSGWHSDMRSSLIAHHTVVILMYELVIASSPLPNATLASAVISFKQIYYQVLGIQFTANLRLWYITCSYNMHWIILTN